MIRFKCNVSGHFILIFLWWIFTNSNTATKYIILGQTLAVEISLDWLRKHLYAIYFALFINDDWWASVMISDHQITDDHRCRSYSVLITNHERSSVIIVFDYWSKSAWSLIVCSAINYDHWSSLMWCHSSAIITHDFKIFLAELCWCN